MKRKYLLLASAILLVLGGCYFLFHQVQPLMREHKTDGNKVDNLSGQTVESFVKKYSHLQPPPVEWFESILEKPTRTWDEWIDTNVKFELNKYKNMYWNNGNPPQWFLEKYDTPEKLAVFEAMSRQTYEGYAEKDQERGMSVPPTAKAPQVFPETDEEIENPYHLDIYTGPQDVESIMEEFDHRYGRTFSDERAVEIDAIYPKEAWIQMFLDKGGSFRDIYDYGKYMNSRAVLMMRAKDPSVWKSQMGGVRPASTLEAYTDAFIEREIWIQETWKRALRENPDMTGIAIEGDHYLPMRPNLAYVRIDGKGGTTSWGALLGQEGHALLLRGIEPEGIEIVYIDENYNVTGKPPPWDPNSPASQQLAEKALKERMSKEFQLDSESGTVGWTDGFDRSSDSLSSDESSMDPAEAFANAAKSAREASMAAREAAKAEYEKFENRMRQLEEFATMSDAEIEKKLERQFRKQFLPELPVEQLEQITPKRLERALGTLFQYGYEDGMRRIREDNATLADLLERHFGKRSQPPASVPKNPPRPVPPKPAETTDPSTDTE